MSIENYLCADECNSKQSRAELKQKERGKWKVRTRDEVLEDDEMLLHRESRLHDFAGGRE